MKTPIDPNSIYETWEVAEWLHVSDSTVIRWRKAHLIWEVPGTRRPFKFYGKVILDFANANAPLVQGMQRRKAA